MKHLLIIISKLFTWMGFRKVQKDFEMIDKLSEGQNKIENGQGTFTFSWGDKYVGKWKNGEKWNGTQYDKDGNITKKYVNGVKQ